MLMDLDRRREDEKNIGDCKQYFIDIFRLSVFFILFLLGLSVNDSDRF